MLTGQGHWIIAGHFGAGNLGDELVLEGTLTTLRSVVPDATVVVAGYDPKEITAHHEVDHAISLGDINGCGAALVGATAVIIGGGGLFFDYDGITPAAVLSTEEPWAGLYRLPIMAAGSGVPVALLSVGLGPFQHESGRRVITALLRQVSVATLRDADSLELYQELGGSPLDAGVSADAVWSLPPAAKEGWEEARVAADLPRRYLAVALREPVAAGERLPLRPITSAIQRVASHHDLGVALMVMQKGPTSGDLDVAGAVAHQLSEGDVTAVVLDDLERHAAAALLQGSQVCLAGRLHAMLLAAQAGVPSVSLNYDPKVSGHAVVLGLGDLCLGLDLVTEDLEAALLHCLQDRARISEHVTVAARALRARRERDVDVLRMLSRRTIEATPPQRARGYCAFAFGEPGYEQLADLAQQVAELTGRTTAQEAALLSLQDMVVDRGLREQQTLAALADLKVFLQAQEDRAAELKEASRTLVAETAAQSTQLAHAREEVDQLTGQLLRSEARLRREELAVFRPVVRQGLRFARRGGRLLPVERQMAIRAGLAPLAKRLAPGSDAASAYESARKLRRQHDKGKLPGQLTSQPAAAGLSPTPMPPRGRPDGFDFVVLPVIDWSFRYQRPQQLATHLADAGHRVLYLSTTFNRWSPVESNAELLEQVHPQVWTARLPCLDPQPVIYSDRLDHGRGADVASALRKLLAALGLDRPAYVVQHPFWLDVVRHLGSGLLAYDLMDDHEGFDNTAGWVLSSEQELLDLVDVITLTAPSLAQKTTRSSTVVRNGAEVARFREAASVARRQERIVVGYVGAISHWFDTDLVERCALAHPEWDFLLVGATVGSDARRLSALSNVSLLGERPYTEVPDLIARFDVCLIPFKVIPLTVHTNPVKAYEYLSAGRPVVATAMPEVIAMEPLVHVGNTHADFLAALEQAVCEVSDSTLANQRMKWAARHSWDERARTFADALYSQLPKMSVVVLCYGNLELTKACLASLMEHTRHPSWELVVVDNASLDGTRNYLREFARKYDNVQLVFNDSNLGFAGGNNAGVRVATGQYVVLLNNDTFVTDGWLLGLLRHLRDDPRIGLVGPVTNNIGNEARIPVEYASMEAMAKLANAYTSQRLRQHFDVDTIAFYCVAFRRSVWDAIGELDERFGIGFFEDDDYCRRVREAGLRVVVADDVFVHHHLSAAFDALGAERKRELFERSKRAYEDKWGPWTPHVYRSARAASGR